MSDLVEFLLARIADDEEVARRSPTHHWRVASQPPAGHWASRQVRPGVGTAFVGGHSTAVVEVPSGGGARPGVEPHIARWDPARVLAECEAKRRIVAWHRLIDGLDTEDNPVRGCCNCIASGAAPPYLIAGPCLTLRLLALPYAGHPSYRQEWKP